LDDCHLNPLNDLQEEAQEELFMEEAMLQVEEAEVMEEAEIVEEQEAAEAAEQKDNLQVVVDELKEEKAQREQDIVQLRQEHERIKKEKEEWHRDQEHHDEVRDVLSNVTAATIALKLTSSKNDNVIIHGVLLSYYTGDLLRLELELHLSSSHGVSLCQRDLHCTVKTIIYSCI
jgi:hypothetical protein